MRLTLLFLLLVGNGWASSPTGLWARGDGRARVLIAPCGPSICAVNQWIKPGTPHEKAGDRLILNVTEVAPDRYRGSAYDPQRSRTYGFIMVLHQQTMTTEGCVLWGLICKSMGWARISGPIADRLSVSGRLAGRRMGDHQMFDK